MDSSVDRPDFVFVGTGALTFPPVLHPSSLLSVLLVCPLLDLCFFEGSRRCTDLSSKFDKEKEGNSFFDKEKNARIRGMKTHREGKKRGGKCEKTTHVFEEKQVQEDGACIPVMDRSNRQNKCT